MIVREGRTFAFTPRGVVPLVPPGKKIYVFTARGGAYPAGSPLRALDHQEPYLRAILGVIGLTEIEFIHAGHQSEGETRPRPKASPCAMRVLEASRHE